MRLRPLHEILETLDETGSYENVPFMLEMTEFAGRTMTAARNVVASAKSLKSS